MLLNGDRLEISLPYSLMLLKIDVELILLPYAPISFIIDFESTELVVILPRNWPSSATMIAPSKFSNDESACFVCRELTRRAANIDSHALRFRTSASLSLSKPAL